ncbi:MAG: sulfotransferase [Cyanobacteria bacterium P01_A01_bin.135]
MTYHNCALVIGQGRSGTNWLLDLLDLSPRTHCRNEPNELANSPFSALPTPTLQQPYGDSFTQAWEQAVTTAAAQMGYRDRIAANPKVYLRWLVARLGGAYLLQGQRRRQVAALLNPALRQEQWLAPSWLVNQQQLQQAYPIFKLNQAPGWATWVLKYRPQSTVIHIVRHPGGFLNSWQNRYVSERDAARVRRANCDRLKQIAAADAYWAERMGDIDAMSLDESELWYWCYANETVHRAGQGRANYCLVIYEKLAQDPVATMARIYEACHLPWTKTIEAKIASSATASSNIAAAWTEQLTAAQVQLVNDILAGSSLANYWQTGKELTVCPRTRPSTAIRSTIDCSLA